MKVKYLLFLFVLVSITGCSIFQSGLNISNLKFKIDSADNLDLGGIDVNNKTGLEQFKDEEIAKLYRVVYNDKIPLSFDLYIAVFNPNDGKNDLPPTDVTLTSFPFKLFIDEKETITGNIKESILIPGNGKETIFKVSIYADMWEFFKGNNFNNSVEPVLKYGGKEGITSVLRLIAKPVISTSVGELEYPEAISIVDFKFN